MTVHLHWQVDARPLADDAAAAAVEAALAEGDRAGIEIDVVLVDDATLTSMHGRWLDDATPTDVITFDLGEDGGGPAGELYVSVDCAQRVAAERGVAVARELALYLVHGALHLCGFDDHEPDERAAMRAAESRVMDGLGYESDTAPHDV